MIPAAVLAGGAIVVTLLVLGFLRSGLSLQLKREVVLYTRDDRSIRGVLIANHRDSLVLANAKYLSEAQSPDMPGEVLVPKSNLSFAQALGGE